MSTEDLKAIIYTYCIICGSALIVTFFSIIINTNRAEVPMIGKYYSKLGEYCCSIVYREECPECGKIISKKECSYKFNRRYYYAHLVCEHCGKDFGEVLDVPDRFKD